MALPYIARIYRVIDQNAATESRLQRAQQVRTIAVSRAGRHASWPTVSTIQPKNLSWPLRV